MTIRNAAANKVVIVGENGITVTAQYNPKEVGVDKSVPWQKAPNAHGNTPDLEFTSADGRSMSFELFFDGYEQNIDVHAAFVSKLIKLAEVMSESGPEDKMRPPQVKVTWGTLPEFKGVLESVSTKYTMFNAAGMPVRCTCSVKFKEANRLSFKKGA